MSFNNFKAKIWSKDIQRELERVCVFAADTNQKYSGEIKGLGDTVRIQGVGKPTITVYNNRQKVLLSTPEEVEDSSVSLVVDNVATFNYGVDDIDKAQGANGVLAILNTEASEECANKIDQSIANLSLAPQARLLNGGTAVTITELNVLETIDAALQDLYENDVNPSGLITVTVSPKFYTLFRRAYTKLDTDNSAILKNGQVAKYANAIIRMSNNVAKDSSNNELIQVKTQRALALAKSEAHTEAYRPESMFEDAVKGFILYGTKIVRPKEMINIVATYA